jgi:hypothetical protein
MQCPSCQFENMPGSGRCARCGASLALAAAAIDVHPPRAGRLSRIELAVRRLWHGMGRLRERASQTLAASDIRAEETYFDLPTLIRCIVPGWPQYRRGDLLRALIYLFAYMCFLPPGLVLTGTWLGSLLVGLAGAMHIVTVCDAVVTKFARPNDRVRFTIVCGLVLCFGIYLPVGWIISRVATPISINATIPPFQQGEVLWYSRWATPTPGDIVVYTLPGVTVAGRTSDGQAANFVFAGNWIGRVMGMRGQRVSVNDGRWLVDGVVSKWQPMDRLAFQDGTSWLVPDNHAFVFPEGLVPVGAQIRPAALEEAFVVPMTRVAGRLYFRSLPLSQMSTLH